MSIILSLKETFKESNLIMEVIDNTLHSLHDYISIINKQEKFVKDSSLGKTNVIDLIKKLNSERCILCDDIITGIKAINRLCKAEGLDLFFDGDETNKVELMHFALEYDARLVAYLQKAM